MPASLSCLESVPFIADIHCHEEIFIFLFYVSHFMYFFLFSDTMVGYDLFHSSRMSRLESVGSGTGMRRADRDVQSGARNMSIPSKLSKGSWSHTRK